MVKTRTLPVEYCFPFDNSLLQNTTNSHVFLRMKKDCEIEIEGLSPLADLDAFPHKRTEKTILIFDSAKEAENFYIQSKWKVTMKWTGNIFSTPLLNFDELVDKSIRVMQAYEMKEKAEKAERRKRKVDEDGFILVQHGQGVQEPQLKQKKKESLVNFYGSQSVGKGKIEELKKKFQADRIKLAEMKSARKFKPF